MLGRRDPQRSLFEAQSWPHRVPADSFYARMAAVNDQLFTDDDLAEMYCPDNGRPSLPPSLLCGVLLLQFYDDVSDAEAVDRLLFDLRWKVALNLSLDCADFDPSTLTRFRQRLLKHHQERYAFDRLIAVARTTGLLPDAVTLLMDTTWARGAGAVQDTYTLFRKAIRKLLRQMGYAMPAQRRGAPPEVQRLLATYLDQDQKAKIDWSDPVERAAQLQVLVQDADATLDLASRQAENDDVRQTGWLLTKILGDDVVTDDQGQPQRGEGTATERIISLTEPDQRHGHKSKAQRFNGFKTAVVTEPETELILDIAEVAASHGDGEHLQPSVERVVESAQVTIERIIGDGAYPTGSNLAACATHFPAPIDLIAPLTGTRNPSHVDKSAFQIDLAAQIATCPAGQTVTGKPVRKDRPADLHFQFARATCSACALFARCVQSKVTGRSVSTDAYESYRQALRERQKQAEFKTLYRQRSRVERKQAELVRHGLRRLRYLGSEKRELQRQWTAAVVNLKRLFKLAQSQAVDLHEAMMRPIPSKPRGIHLQMA